MGIWISGGNLNTARSGLAGAGTVTAGLCMGGNSSSASDVTEEYNGSSWTSGGNLSVARYYLAGFGTQIAGVSVGGFDDTNNVGTTEEYDGTSWASGGGLGTARRQLAATGTIGAGLCVGGYFSTESVITDLYDGTSWSISGNLNTARKGLASAGTQTAGLCFGGSISSVSNIVEEFDGSSWSITTSLLIARAYLTGTGLASATLSIGGSTGSISSVTEEFDGTTWSTGGNLSTARDSLASSGTQESSICMGGDASGVSNVTEEYEYYLSNHLFVDDIGSVSDIGMILLINTDSGISADVVSITSRDIFDIFNFIESLSLDRSNLLDLGIGLEYSFFPKDGSDSGAGTDISTPIDIFRISLDTGSINEYIIFEKDGISDLAVSNFNIFLDGKTVTEEIIGSDNSLIQLSVYENIALLESSSIGITDFDSNISYTENITEFTRDSLIDTFTLTDIGTIGQGFFEPNQSRYIDPFSPYIFKYNLAPNNNFLYLAKVPNNILSIIGNDLVIQNLKIISITVVPPSTIEVLIDFGRAIADNTLIHFTIPTTISLNCSNLTDTYNNSSHLGIFVNYNYLHTSSSPPASIDIFHISSDGTVSDSTTRFNLIRHRILIGIINFTKDDEDNVIDAYNSTLHSLLVNGKQMSLNGLTESSISDLFSNVSIINLFEYRDYLLKKDYLFME